MIFDKIDNLYRYISADAYSNIKDFLRKIEDDIPEGEYEICGERIYARVMSYATKPCQECKIEAHRRYIDIQSTIYGAEGIGIYSQKGLAIFENYNAAADVELFNQPGIEVAYAYNFPEYFTMLLPGEAHSPQQKVGKNDYVKKFVIKVLA